MVLNFQRSLGEISSNYQPSGRPQPRLYFASTSDELIQVGRRLWAGNTSHGKINSANVTHQQMEETAKHINLFASLFQHKRTESSLFSTYIFPGGGGTSALQSLLLPWFIVWYFILFLLLLFFLLANSPLQRFQTPAACLHGTSASCPPSPPSLRQPHSGCT